MRAAREGESNTAARLALLAVSAVFAVSSWGCAFGEIHWKDPLKRGYSLELVQRKYTELVRWSEFGKASSFVERDLRETYLSEAPSTRELRFTDYETGRVDIDPENGEATVQVTYLAYRPSSPIEIRVREVQQWSRAGVGNSWQVRPRFVDLESLALQSTAR